MPSKKKQSKYPLIAFRPNVNLDKRLRRFALRNNVPISQIVRHCLMAHLPKMEKQFID